MEKLWVKTAVLLIGAIIGLIAFILIPSIIFKALNDWTYFESIYFSFVSLTTVGFGDFVPRIPSSLNGFYRVCLGGWIFFGLAFVALVITRVQEYMMNTGDRLNECRNKVSKRVKDRMAKEMRTNEKRTASVV